MSSFVVYTYQFAPLQTDSSCLFPDKYTDPDAVWKNKQEILSSVYQNIVFHYRKTVYEHENKYNENSIIVFKIANNKHLTQEASFVAKKLEHHPSCYVIIDNRKDVQNIFIEEDSYSFSDSSVVANILQSSFNAILKSYGLILSINKRFKSEEFWQYVSSVEDGVRMLRFSFLYPNLPRVQEKIDEAIARSSRQVRSKNTLIEYNSGEDETLSLSPEDNDLCNLVDAASMSGSEIKVRAKKMRRIKVIGETTEIIEIENLEASLSADLLSSVAQKLISILNKFK